MSRRLGSGLQQGFGKRCRRARPTDVHGRPLLDTHRPTLLAEGSYRADGQIEDEVFEWGSFLQSRMHARGVTCSDCHDPHAGRPRGSGNETCARCHDWKRFGGEHTHHAEGSAGSRCVACHMPTRTYMGVDARHDHSLRAPRPDLTVRLGLPNACGACHADRGAQWQADAVVRWFGEKRHDDAALEAFSAARRGALDGPRRLRALALDAARAPIVRAGALEALRAYPSEAGEAAVRAGAADSDPLVRMAAAAASASLPPRARADVAVPLLDDPVRAVRHEAVAALLGTVPAEVAVGAAFRRARDEYLAAQRFASDTPAGLVNLGNVALLEGDAALAEREFRAALAIEPTSAPARVDLAEALRRLGDEAGAEAVLRAGLVTTPDDADLLHALGLARVRAGDAAGALSLLARAAERAPGYARYAYVHAVALDSAGDRSGALAVVRAALRRRPGERALLEMLASWLDEAGDAEGARAALRDVDVLGR